MTAVHDTGELTCARCGEALELLAGEVATAAAVTADELLRVAIYCPGCEAPLEFVIKSAFPSATTVDIWVEDRRRSTG
jgi:hypothetical protein